MKAYFIGGGADRQCIDIGRAPYPNQIYLHGDIWATTIQISKAWIQLGCPLTDTYAQGFENQGTICYVWMYGG